MNLKNYTSTVPVPKTMARIEEILMESGATGIAKEFKDGHVDAVFFRLEVDGKDIAVRLPANPNAVYESLRKQCVRPRPGTLDRIREQAERPAWKIQQDWLEIELTKLRLKQTEPLQAFMAYLWDGRRTLFEVYRERGFKALPEKTDA